MGSWIIWLLGFSETHRVELGDIAVYLALVEGIVYQVAVEILVIAGHVYQTVSRQVEQDNLLFACLLALVGLADCRSYGMARLRRGDYALPPCKQRTGINRLELLDVYRLHQTIL